MSMQSWQFLFGVLQVLGSKRSVPKKSQYIADINQCVPLHTMPTLEGELPSVYSVRLSRVAFVQL